MPFMIVHHAAKGGDSEQWCVHTQDDSGDPKGAAHGCHPTKAQAIEQMRALYANVPYARKKSLDTEDEPLLLAYGGAVKSAPGSTLIEGIAVPFGSPTDRDLDGEYFSAETDFGLQFPARVHLFWNHGLDVKVGRVPLGRAELWEAADGIHFKADLNPEADDEEVKWLEGEREKSRKYRRLALKLAREGLVGSSSGAASHVVVKAEGAIKRWPFPELSVTVHPANRATVPVTVKTLSELPSLEEAAGEVTAAPSLAESTERLIDAWETAETQLKALGAETERVHTAYTSVAVKPDAVKAGAIMSAARRARYAEMVQAHADAHRASGDLLNRMQAFQDECSPAEMAGEGGNAETAEPSPAGTPAAPEMGSPDLPTALRKRDQISTRGRAALTLYGR